MMMIIYLVNRDNDNMLTADCAKSVMNTNNCYSYRNLKVKQKVYIYSNRGTFNLEI